MSNSIVSTYKTNVFNKLTKVWLDKPEDYRKLRKIECKKISTDAGNSDSNSITKRWEDALTITG